MDVWQDGEQLVLRNVNWKTLDEDTIMTKKPGEVFYDFLQYVESRFTQAGLDLKEFNMENDFSAEGIAALTPQTDFWIVTGFALSGHDQYVLYEHLRKSVFMIEQNFIIQSALRDKTPWSTGEALVRLPILQNCTESALGYFSHKGETIEDCDGVWETSPTNFSCSFIENSSGDISPCYHVNTARELLAVDFVTYYKSKKIGRIGYCVQCGKLFKQNRVDSKFCSAICGRKFNEIHMSEYDKKYRYMRKYVSECTPLPDTKKPKRSSNYKARKAWGNYSKSLLRDINDNKQYLTTEQFAKEMRQKWEEIRLEYNIKS